MGPSNRMAPFASAWQSLHRTKPVLASNIVGGTVERNTAAQQAPSELHRILMLIHGLPSASAGPLSNKTRTLASLDQPRTLADRVTPAGTKSQQHR